MANSLRASKAVPLATLPLAPLPLEQLRAALLAWGERHGRHNLPWKLRPDGLRPADGEPLDPFKVLN